MSPFPAAWQSFAAAGVANGAIVSYILVDANGNMEFGRGTYNSTGPTLARTQILASSNGGAPIVLSGNAQVFVTYLAEDLTAGPTQRSITASGNLPIVALDRILNINAATDLAPTVPLSTTRNGAPLTFKNAQGSHAQTLTLSGSDTLAFDGGGTTLSLPAGASVTIYPLNDGVNTGWAIE